VWISFQSVKRWCFHLRLYNYEVFETDVVCLYLRPLSLKLKY